MATPGGPRPNYNPNSIADNMQNLQINRPNQPPNSGAGPRGPVPPFGQQPFPSSAPFSSPFSGPGRPGAPPPGAVPRGAVSPSTGPPQGTLPPFMAPNRAPGGAGGGPPGSNPPPPFASRPMAPPSTGPVPSSTGGIPGPRPGPFAGPPVGPPNVGGGMVSNGPPMFGPGGMQGGPQFPSAGVRPRPPAGPPPSPPTMSLPTGPFSAQTTPFSGTPPDHPPRGPTPLAPSFSAPPRGPPTFSAQAQGMPQQQASPFGAQPWQVQSRPNVPPPPIPGSGQPPRMYGMQPPLPNQQAMATISPTMGAGGAAVTGPPLPNQIPRPIPNTSVLLHETRRGKQANPPPPATSEFIVRDTGNCSSRYMRCTINQEHIIRTGHGCVSVILYGDEEKPPLITYPDVALNHMSCFKGLFFSPEAASLLLHNFCIYHITPPGHELGAASICPDVPVPSVDDLCDQILEVLNHFRSGSVQ